MAWMKRLRGLWKRERINRELDEELRYHFVFGASLTASTPECQRAKRMKPHNEASEISPCKKKGRAT